MVVTLLVCELYNVHCFSLTTDVTNVEKFLPSSGIEPETFCNLDQLEKLEAARSAFLLLPLVTFPGL